ncbi:hypothetical protein JHK85_056725 [Glycine max]|nr:hypothetical protein JHK85_056725 [Glycine max]
MVHMEIQKLEALEKYRNTRLYCNFSGKNHTNTLPPQVAATYVWNPPHTGSLKCNLDVALFIDQNKFGIGFCMRDDQGTFIKARTELYPGTPTAHEAEKSMRGVEIKNNIDVGYPKSI